MKKIILGCLLSWGLMVGIGSSVQAATLDCSTATNINVPVAECQALLDLYDSTNGPSWTNNGGWDTDSNVCTWYGIACTNIAGQDKVISIQLGWNNLVGTLPSSLSALDQISSFQVGYNQLSGPLPDAWSTWTNISSFQVGYNQLSGPLPDAWSTWTNISSFQVYYNQLSGPLPDARSAWSNIQYFNVSSNQLSGPLPDAWSTWTNISSFQVYNNQLSGPLPDAWSSWTNISSFQVGYNQLSGPLPDAWSTWTNISYFQVGSNQLSGPLPDAWSSWTNISYFDVGSNQLSGPLPDAWSSWTNISYFQVGYNQLSGPLPDAWSTWTNISYFQVGSNQLSGPLPDAWSTWTNISYFQVGSNQLSGPLPDAWSSWTNISYFDVGSNQLSGPLPDAWSSWTNISSFQVYNNQLSGPLPDAWSSWTNISYFQVGYNQLSGPLPDAWSTWTNISYFQVGSNQLSGPLPDAWSSWTNISSFQVYNNQLSGPLPDAWSSWTNISYFQVGSNQLSGPLPDAWSTWTNISSFQVGSNQLSGEIPNSRSTDRPNHGWQYIELDYNCIQIDGYPASQQNWIDTNIGSDPQSDCGSRDLSITKTLLQPLTLYPGDLVGYSLYYENNGTDPAYNVIIADIPGNGLSIISASVPYSAQTITGDYGVHGDSCFDDMTNNTIGYYTDTLNQRAVDVYGAPNFQTVLENELGWTGGVNRGAWRGTNATAIFGASSFYNAMNNLSINLSIIDSSCGTPDQFGYSFNLGTVGAGVTGEILLTGQVAMTGFTLGQTGIMNTAEISTSSSELSLSNNRSSVITPLTGITTSSTGSSTGGSSTSSGSSGANIIPTGFGGGFGGHTTTPSTGKVHNSAPTVVEQEVIEDNFSCPYGDGDFETYTDTMRDIPKTGAKREAILQLLKKCVVHGKRGEGKLYGTYNRITYGEVYKIIVRSLGLPFDERKAGHRAFPYKVAARKAKLLEGSNTSHNLDDIAETKDVIVLLTNMVKYNGGSIDSLSLESIRTPYILRGKFALLVTSLLKK